MFTGQILVRATTLREDVTNFSRRGGTHGHLCDTHKPFRTKNKVGDCASTTVMQLQLSASETRLLPARPVISETRQFCVISTRGGYELHVIMQSSRLLSGSIKINAGDLKCEVWRGVKVVDQAKVRVHPEQRLSGRNELGNIRSAAVHALPESDGARDLTKSYKVFNVEGRQMQGDPLDSVSQKPQNEGSHKARMT